MLASAAESHVVKHYAVGPDQGGFTDDHAGSVVAEIPFADGRAGVDFKPGQESADLRKEPRDEGNSESPKQVNEPVERDRLETGIDQEFEVAAGGVVPIAGLDIFYYGNHNFSLY